MGIACAKALRQVHACCVGRVSQRQGVWSGVRETRRGNHSGSRRQVIKAPAVREDFGFSSLTFLWKTLVR